MKITRHKGVGLSKLPERIGPTKTVPDQTKPTTFGPVFGLEFWANLVSVRSRPQTDYFFLLDRTDRPRPDRTGPTHSVQSSVSTFGLIQSRP